jgi:Nucleotidyltransferase domain
MHGVERPAPEAAAQDLVVELIGDVRSAILAGSVVTGNATVASDLDIVVIGDDPDAPFRRSIRYEGWPAEIFVHSEETIRGFWAVKDERVRPALALMCARGQIVLDHDGSGARMQAEARKLLLAGPPSLSKEELDRLRYGVTDSLDDFLAVTRDAERPFILSSLVEALCELAMENRRAFRGRGKWTYRMAEEADPSFAADLTQALEAVTAGDGAPLVALTRLELDAAGGPLFEGYWADGRPILDAG